MTGTSQLDEILEYMESGGRLTSLEALWLFGCNRLAARINDLRKEGFKIDTRMINTKSVPGNTVRVAEYSMKCLF